MEVPLECKLGPLACGPPALSMDYCWQLIGFLLQLFWGCKERAERKYKCQ